MFSVVALLPAENHRRRGDLERLLRTIYSRIRTTDEVGWFDEQRVGILLPYTPPAGAWVVAEDICVAMRPFVPDLTFNVYAYPGSGRDFGPGSESLNQRHPNGKKQTAGTENVVKFNLNDGRGPLSTLEQQSIQPPGNERVPALDLLPAISSKLPVWKRTLDIVVSAASLLALSPVMLAVSIAIKLTSHGPILFRQERTGFAGQIFTMFKFRTMDIDADARKSELLRYNEQSGPVFKIKSDPRVNPVGRLLRRSSLDELPQFWNILKGDMSLVGPRPLPCDEAHQYQGWQRLRFTVTPGLTCIWQVSGRSQVEFERRVRMDVSYAKFRSFVLDFVILLRTLPAVLSGRGAY